MRKHGITNKDLLNACRSNDTTRALKILDTYDVDDLLDVTVNDGRTALYYACHNDNSRIALKLIEAKANLNIQNIGGGTALMVACKKSEILTAALIKNKADVNLTTKHGDSALIFACCHNNSKIISILLDAKADVNLKNNVNSTVLHACALNRNCDRKFVTFKLIENKADMDIQTQNGETALIFACKRNHEDVATILIDTYLANQKYHFINVQNNAKKTFIDYANETKMVNVLKKIQLLYKKILLKEINEPGTEIHQSFGHLGDINILGIICEYIV